MKRILLGLVMLVTLIIETVNLQAQLPAVEQVWPTASKPATYTEGRWSWVTANPQHSHLYVYAHGKLYRGIQSEGTWAWKEIGKGLPKNACFTGVDGYYACPLTFSRVDPEDYGEAGYSMLLGSSSKGGVPYRSDDDGETWYPLNICEKGPGYNNQNFTFDSFNVGVFSKSTSTPENIFISTYCDKYAGAVFVCQELNGKHEIVRNPLYRPRIDDCLATDIPDIKCPPNSGSQGCFQYNDNPWYWGGDFLLTVLPGSNNMFETDTHPLINRDLPECAPLLNTKYKVYDGNNSQLGSSQMCTLDNVYFDYDTYGTPRPINLDNIPQRLWHFTSPVFYSEENNTFYTVISQIIQFTGYEVLDGGCLDKIAYEINPPVLAKCESMAGGDWIFSEVSKLTTGGYKNSSMNIQKHGDLLFFTIDTSTEGSSLYDGGYIVSYNIQTSELRQYGSDKTNTFAVYDLGNSGYDVYYLNTSIPSSVKLKAVKIRMGNEPLIEDVASFTSVIENTTEATGFYNSIPTPTIFYGDTLPYTAGPNAMTLKARFIDFSPNSRHVALNPIPNECDLCTLSFTAATTIEKPNNVLWAYLSSDAGIWRNKEFNNSDRDTFLNGFEQISGGYTTGMADPIPETDFGNYCSKVILGPTEDGKTTLYAACKSGLWKGIETVEGGAVGWARVFTPAIQDGVDAGVRDVLVSGTNIFSVTAEGIWRSSDDQNWPLIFSTTLNVPVTAIAAFQGTPSKIVWAVGSSLYDPNACGTLYASDEDGDNPYILAYPDSHNVPIKQVRCVAEDGCDLIYYLTNAGILNKVSVKFGCSAITISPASLPSGLAGASYSQTLAATGGQGSYTFKRVSGSLPPGLTLRTDGVLSGTPTEIGSYSFDIMATDANCCTGIQEYSIQIYCPEIIIEPSILTPGVVGLNYDKYITASPEMSSCHFTFATEGPLPNGITLSEDGHLFGKPETAITCTFTVKVVDACGCIAVKEYSLNVLADWPSITIEPQSPKLPGQEDTVVLSNGITYDWYDQILTPSGSTPPYTLSVSAGELPPGTSLVNDQYTGWHLSGYATYGGVYSFSITATDAIGCGGSQKYKLTVAPVTIMSKTVELACENGVAHFVLRLQGSGLSAKLLSFFSYIEQSDGTKADYEMIRPMYDTDGEVLISIPSDWTFSRAIEVKMARQTADLSVFIDSFPVSPLYTPIHAEPEGGSIAGGTEVIIHGMGFAEGTRILFNINGGWVDQNAAFASENQMTLTATTGPTCEGPVDMKVVYPSGCELVVPSAYIYGYQATLYTDKLSGGALGWTKIRFFVCPGCPSRGSAPNCPTTFINGDSSQKSSIGYKVYASCASTQSAGGGGMSDIAYVSSTEMTGKLPIIPATCSAFLASRTAHPQGCSDAIFTLDYDSIPDSSDPCDYRYHTYNEGLTTGGMDSDANGFMSPIDTDNNAKLSWTSRPENSLMTFTNEFISSASILSMRPWWIKAPANMAIVTPSSRDWNQTLPLAYVADVSNHKVVDVDGNPGNGITGVPMPEFYGVKTPLATATFSRQGSGPVGERRYALIVGYGPSPLQMWPTATPILNIVDLSIGKPTSYKVINKYMVDTPIPRIGVDISLATKCSDVPRNYAFISEFIFQEGSNPPPPIECPPCLPDHGRPIPTPRGYKPGLLILDIQLTGDLFNPIKIVKVGEYIIEGNADNGMENFALTFAKNTTYNDLRCNNVNYTTNKPYVYIVAPGANKVLIYSVGTYGELMDFVRDIDGNIRTYDVGETPTDLAWAHYENPPGTWNDKVFVTCLNATQVDSCDSVYGLNVQTLAPDDYPYPTEDPCLVSDKPLPTAIDFRTDGQFGYVVKGYGGLAPNGVIHVFSPAFPDDPLQWRRIDLAFGTNPTRFDAGYYPNTWDIQDSVKETIIDAPETYFDAAAHKQALLNQTKAVETLLPTSASNTAINAKLSAMEKDVKKWVVHQETKDALVLQLETEKTFVLVQRRAK